MRRDMKPSIDWQIDPLPEVQATGHATVIINLLSNALKYTRNANRRKSRSARRVRTESIFASATMRRIRHEVCESYSVFSSGCTTEII